VSFENRMGGNTNQSDRRNDKEKINLCYQGTKGGRKPTRVSEQREFSEYGGSTQHWYLVGGWKSPQLLGAVTEGGGVLHSEN